MSEYLSRLRQKNAGESAHDANCKNRVKDFTQFMQSRPLEKKSVFSAEKSEAELRALVELCAAAYGFTEIERDEALECALRNPTEALTCFREISREIEAERPPTLRGEAND